MLKRWNVSKKGIITVTMWSKYCLRHLEKYRETNSVENRPQNERLRATSKQQVRKLIRLAQSMRRRST